MNTIGRTNMMVVEAEEGRNHQQHSSSSQESNNNNNHQHAMMIQAGDRSCHRIRRHDKGDVDADLGDDSDILITTPSSSSSTDGSLDCSNNNINNSTHHSTIITRYHSHHAHHYADLIPVLDEFKAAAAAISSAAVQEEETPAEAVPEETPATLTIPRRRQQEPARRRRLALLAKAQAAASASRNKRNSNSPPPGTAFELEKANGRNNGDDNSSCVATNNADVSVAASNSSGSSLTATLVTTAFRSLVNHHHDDDDDDDIPQVGVENGEEVCQETTTRAVPLQGKPDRSRSNSRSPLMMIRAMTSIRADLDRPILVSSPLPTNSNMGDHNETSITSVVDTSAATTTTTNPTVDLIPLERASSVRSLSNSTNKEETILVPPPPTTVTTTTSPRRVTYPVYPHFGNGSSSSSSSSNRKLPTSSSSSGVVVMHRTVPLFPSSPPIDQPRFVVMSSKGNFTNNNNQQNITPAMDSLGHSSTRINHEKEKKQETMTRSHSLRLINRRRNLKRTFSSSPLKNSALLSSSASAESKTATTRNTQPETTETTRPEKEPEICTVLSTSNQTENDTDSNSTDADAGAGGGKEEQLVATVPAGCEFLQTSGGTESTDSAVSAVYPAESTITQALISYHGTRLRKMLHQEDQASVRSMSERYNDKRVLGQAKCFVNADTQGAENEGMVDIITTKSSTASKEKVEMDDDALTTLAANDEMKKIRVVTNEATLEAADWDAVMTKDMSEHMSATTADGQFNATHRMRHRDDHEDDKKRSKNASPSSAYTAATFATLTSSSSYSSLSTSPMAVSLSSSSCELEDNDCDWENILDSLNDAAAIEEGISCDHGVSDDTPHQHMENPVEDDKDNTSFLHHQHQKQVSQREQNEEQSPIVSKSLEAGGFTIEAANTVEETKVIIQQTDDGHVEEASSKDVISDTPSSLQRAIMSSSPVVVVETISSFESKTSATSEHEFINPDTNNESEQQHETVNISETQNGVSPPPKSSSLQLAVRLHGGDVEASSHIEPVASTESDRVDTCAGDNDRSDHAQSKPESKSATISIAITGADLLAVSTSNDPIKTLLVGDQEPQQEAASSKIISPEAINRKSAVEAVTEKPASSQTASGEHTSDESDEYVYESSSTSTTDGQQQQQTEDTMKKSKNKTSVEQVVSSQNNASIEEQKPAEELTCLRVLQPNDEDYSTFIKARKALIADLLVKRNMALVEQQQKDDSENRTVSSVVQAAQEKKVAEISNPESTQQRQIKEVDQEPTRPAALHPVGRDSTLMEVRKALIVDLANFHSGGRRTAEPPSRLVTKEVKKSKICTETLTEAPGNTVETEHSIAAPLITKREIISVVENKQETTHSPAATPTTIAIEGDKTLERHQVSANQTTPAEMPTSNTANDTRSLERKEEKHECFVAANEPMREAVESKSPRAARTMEFKPLVELIRKDVWSRDPVVTEWALQLITIEAFMDHEARARIARLGGLLAIVGAMETHASMYRVQIAACQALEKLALDHDNENAIAHIGGVDAVLAALVMGQHADNAAVQGAAWGALSSMTNDFVETDIAINAVGGFATLLSCMKRNANNAAVQGIACRALASLCQGNETRLRALVAVDGIVAVAATLQAHWNDPDVRREAGNALSALCSSE